MDKSDRKTVNVDFDNWLFLQTLKAKNKYKDMNEALTVVRKSMEKK